MNYSTMTFEELEKVHKSICELTGSLDLQTIIYGLELYYIFINEIPEKYKEKFDYVEYDFGNLDTSNISTITKISPAEIQIEQGGYTYALSGKKLKWNYVNDLQKPKYSMITVLPYPEYKAQLETSFLENPES